MLEPLYTAEEARAAEEGHDVAELMERAGAAVAREVLRRFPDARRIAVVCGGGSNGGDGRIAARILREEGRDAVETTAVEQADVIVDALFGTGFRGEPRDEAAATIARINAAGVPVVAVDVPSGGRRVHRRDRRRRCGGGADGDVPRPQARARGRSGLFHPARSSSRTSGWSPPRPRSSRDRRDPRARAAQAGRGQQVQRGLGARRRRGAGDDRRRLSRCRGGIRADAGYVAVAVPGGSLAVVEAKLLEPVKLTWADAREAAEKARALAIGPGLGRDAAAKALRDELIGSGDQSLVLDADALHELEPGDWGARAVLTPHAGELGAAARRGAPPGWTRTGSKPHGDVRSGSAASACSRARTRSSPARARARSSARRGAGARDRRDRRRPHRDPGRVPREGPRAAPRGGRRGDGATARGTGLPQAG